MKIFVSHSSKNSEIAKTFTRFLEGLNSNIVVFCSSEIGSIKIGENFIKTIFDELENSDLFVPIISKEYYESKFCMIELGVAYSYMYSRFGTRGENFIFPFALCPVQKSQALSGTPMSNIQAGSLTNENDIHTFLKQLDEIESGIGNGMNQALRSFVASVSQMCLEQPNIFKKAKKILYFDEDIYFNKKEDIANIDILTDSIMVNFNMNPYSYTNFKMPNYIGVALKYIDTLDMNYYLDVNDQAKFMFTITSFTNSLERIFVEFKHTENNKTLEAFNFPIKYGENKLSVSLDDIKCKALSNITEICFVIHPSDVTGNVEGGFKISDVGISAAIP